MAFSSQALARSLIKQLIIYNLYHFTLKKTIIFQLAAGSKRHLKAEKQKFFFRFLNFLSPSSSLVLLSYSLILKKIKKKEKGN